MIRLLKKGQYQLTETKRHTRILTMDKTKAYAWISSARIGEMLESVKHHSEVGRLLALGKYRLYEVKDEPELTDLKHLELFVGEGKWQGYLLPTGLPSEEIKRHLIVPTQEIITKSLA